MMSLPGDESAGVSAPVVSPPGGESADVLVDQLSQWALWVVR